MELWIRNQDKNKLIKVEGLSLVYPVNGTVDINITFKDYCETVGNYKSKERALEVLDEIQKFIIVNISAKFNIIVYEMPVE